MRRTTGKDPLKYACNTIAERCSPVPSRWSRFDSNLEGNNAEDFPRAGSSGTLSVNGIENYEFRRKRIAYVVSSDVLADGFFFHFRSLSTFFFAATAAVEKYV